MSSFFRQKEPSARPVAPRLSVPHGGALMSLGGMILAVLLAVPARSQVLPSYLLEQLRDFSTFQQSQVGASPELLKLVVEQVAADIQKEKLDEGNAPVLAVDFPGEVRRALERLSTAYTEKRRTAFLRFVSPEYMGDRGLLEDALRNDFKVYRTVDLRLIPERVDVNDKLAVVDVHYTMRVTDDSGRLSDFDGHTNFTFRLERALAFLFKMGQPFIFGNSLPPDQNPMARRQGVQTTSGGTAPGAASDSVSGAATIRQRSTGFKFDEANEPRNVPESQADVKQLSQDFAAANGGQVKSMGYCEDIKSITSVPANVKGQFAAAHISECYAVRTGTNRYALLRVTAVMSGSISFQYKFQRRVGSNSF